MRNWIPKRLAADYGRSHAGLQRYGARHNRLSGSNRDLVCGMEVLEERRLLAVVNIPDPAPLVGGSWIVDVVGSDVRVRYGANQVGIAANSAANSFSLNIGVEDTVTISQGATAIATPVDIHVSGSGGTNPNRIIYDDSGSATSVTYVLASTGNFAASVARTSAGLVSVDGTWSNLQLELKTSTSSTSHTNVAGTAQGISSTTISVGHGNQDVVVGGTARTLIPIKGSVIVQGGHAVIDDYLAPATSLTYTLTTSSGSASDTTGTLTRSSTPVVIHFGPGSVALNEVSVFTRVDAKVDVKSTLSNVLTTVHQRNSNGPVTVGNASRTLDSIFGDLRIIGGDIRFDDAGNTASLEYELSTDPVTAGLGSLTRIGGALSPLEIEFALPANGFGILGVGVNMGTSPTSELVIDKTLQYAGFTDIRAGDPSQTILIGNPGRFLHDDINNMPRIYGGALTIDDSAGPTSLPLTYELGAADIAREARLKRTGGAFFSWITYGPNFILGNVIAELSSLHIKTAAGASNQVQVLKTLAPTSTTITLGNAAQAVNIGAGNLDTIPGDVTISGGGALHVNDSLGLTTNAYTYAFTTSSATSGTLTRAGGTVPVEVNFGTPASVRLTAAPGSLNAINVNSTVDDGLTTIDAGHASQAVLLGTGGGSSSLDSLRANVNVNGGAVLIDDAGTSTGTYAYSLTTASGVGTMRRQPSVGDPLLINYAPRTSPTVALSALTLKMGTVAGSALRVNGTTSGTTTKVEAGNAAQVVTLGTTAGTGGLSMFLSSLTVHGGTIVVDDDELPNTTAWTYKVTNTSVERTAPSMTTVVINYGTRAVNPVAVPSLTLQMGRSAANVANVLSTAVPTNVAGGASVSGQSINVGSFSFGGLSMPLSSFGHALGLSGTNVTYTFDDRGNSGDFGVAITDTYLRHNDTGTPQLAYSGAATVTVRLGSGSNYSTVASLPSAPVTVLGGTGQNSMVRLLSSISSGTMIVDGGSSVGGFELYVSDNAVLTSKAYAFAPGPADYTRFTRDSLQVDYRRVNTFTLHGSKAIDTLTINNPVSTITDITLDTTGPIDELVTVLGTLSGKTLNIGSANVSIGNATTPIDNIKGRVNLGLGISNVAIHDEAANGSHVYDFLDDSGMNYMYRDVATATATAKIYMNGYQNVTLSTNSGNNTFNIARLDPALTISAGSGDDTLNLDLVTGTGNLIFNAGLGSNTAWIRKSWGTVTYNGAAGSDTVNIGNAAGTLNDIGPGIIYVNGGVGGNLTMNVHDENSEETLLVDNTAASPPTITRTDLSDGGEGQDPQAPVVIKYTNVTTKNFYLP